MALAKRNAWCGLVLLTLAWALMPHALRAADADDAEVQVEVVEAGPRGERLALPPGSTYHLRLRYASDAPVRIWVRPWSEGREVPTATHGSPLHEGSGETSGWFALDRPWQRVDEVRISIGDGSRHSREVLRHRVHIVADPDAAAAGPEPAWIGENRERNRARDRVDRERPQDDGGLLSSLFASAFVMAIPAVGILGVVLPVLAWRRWRGGWRLAAALPLVAFGLMLLVIIVGVAFDPTSNNLWPLTLMVVAFWGLVWIGFLALLRRVFRRGERTARR